MYLEPYMFSAILVTFTFTDKAQSIYYGLLTQTILIGLQHCIQAFKMKDQIFPEPAFGTGVSISGGLVGPSVSQKYQQVLNPQKGVSGTHSFKLLIW